MSIHAALIQTTPPDEPGRRHHLVIAQHECMTAINSALEIDLTGQSTAESIGTSFYKGIGGQADFMRGAVLAPGGKTILTLQSTARGGQVSRIVPFLKQGAGVTLNRSDIHYVVTGFGIAHIHGKSIRERAMDLISITHPAFRHALVEEARRQNLIYGDREFVVIDYTRAMVILAVVEDGTRSLVVGVGEYYIEERRMA